MPTYLHGALSAHLPPLRLVSRVNLEYAGACPFCGGDPHRSDRFHLWLLPTGRERYWCRRCECKGPIGELHRLACQQQARMQTDMSHEPAPPPQPEHIPQYRRLYALVASWAETQLRSPWNPEPLRYLQQRGFDHEQIGWARLGYALNDPDSLVAHLRRNAPTLLPYAVEAGLLTQTSSGVLETHWNLRGRIVIPYQDRGQIIDLRTRRFPGRGYTSLPGGYQARGVTTPLCWDEAREAEIVIITEGELKALAVTAAYRRGLIISPALAHPGLSYFRSEWARSLVRSGVRIAILAYDARLDRPVNQAGEQELAPEERWTIRHGQSLAAAGLQVLVLDLPLAPGAIKEDLDSFLLRAGPKALSDLLLGSAIPLSAFCNRLPPALRAQAEKVANEGVRPWLR